jgi:hypothetical protein
MPKKGSTAHGYGPAHRKERARQLVYSINTMCPCCWGQPSKHHCDGLMLDPARMDLDHSTPIALGGTGVGDRLICLPCNRSAGGSLGNRLRDARASRDW